MKVEKIMNNTESEGFFKAFIPLKEENGSSILEKDIGGIKKKFLVGEASNTVADKGDDRISKVFIDKMANSVAGLNVFVEHEHHIDNTIGFIDEAKSVDNSLVVSTNLEPEEDNNFVDKILKKMSHGTKMFYSISGKVTKAVRKFDESLKKTIREIIDGEIYEVSLTALPEGNVSFVEAIQKSMNSFVQKANKSDIIESVDKSLIEKITKTLAEMVQSNKIDDQIYDLFYAFRNAIYKITWDSELSPEQKAEKITSLASEYSTQVEELSQELASLTETIETEMSN